MTTTIKYRITGFDPTEHQIFVRFFSDDLPESELVSAWGPGGKPAAYRTDYALTLPVPAPSGDDLRDFIMRHCPVHWFELKRAIADPLVDTSLPEILVGTVTEVSVTPA